VIAVVGAKAWDFPPVEAGLWSVPLVLATLRFARGARGARSGWLLIALACAVIVADKLFDLHAFALGLGHWIVGRVDPEEKMRGEKAMYRNAILAVLFLGASLALFWLARRDRELGGGKLLSFLGLVVVLGLVAARAMPLFKELLAGPLAKVIEVLAWLCVAGGVLLGKRRERPG